MRLNLVINLSCGYFCFFINLYDYLVIMKKRYLHMLLNLTDFKYLDIERFIGMIDERDSFAFNRSIDGYSAIDAESFIYGEYEYCGGNSVIFPGELYKKWETVDYDSTGSYSGTVDASGNVTLSKDYSETTIHHFIYRRRFDTVDDEIRRYGEYCFHYISAIKNMSEKRITNATAAGGKVESIYYQFKEITDKINWQEAEKDVTYTINLKITLCKMYEAYFKEPFEFVNSGKDLVFHFVSKVMAPGEEQYLGKKDVKKREKVHFAFLEEAANKIRHFTLGKNPHKTAKHVLSIVFLAVWGAFSIFGGLTGIFGGLKNGENLISKFFGMFAYFSFMAHPFLIIGLIFLIIVAVQYSSYKKFNKYYKQFIKE